jgi:hypothetical protein
LREFDVLFDQPVDGFSLQACKKRFASHARQEDATHHLSKSAAIGFGDAIAATKEALQQRGFAILAEIDLGEAGGESSRRFPSSCRGRHQGVLE